MSSDTIAQTAQEAGFTLVGAEQAGASFYLTLVRSPLQGAPNRATHTLEERVDPVTVF